MNKMVLLWNSQNENIHPPKTQDENSSMLLWQTQTPVLPSAVPGGSSGVVKGAISY